MAIRITVFIRVQAGAPVMACCPMIPGMCATGTTVTEVTRELRQRVREAILQDPSLLGSTSVTFLDLDFGFEPTD
ncbi:MAG: hypothetical protein HYY25_11950 [Candidatus Wallbacteria bacterium]|nr:hypothetical protein [Candidatus Wallbacteria bacterium]